MVRVVIVEDEPLSADRLERMILRYGKNFNVVAKLDSVASAINWLSNNQHPDLLLLDIQLGDGLSFEIIEKSSPKSNLIFITAYSEYAVKAFTVNSLHYLLKPIDFDELSSALDRYLTKNSDFNLPTVASLDKALLSLTKSFKKRFSIRIADKIIILPIESIAAFESLDGDTYAINLDGKHLNIDYTLEDLQDLIDPSLFFRVNRKYIVSLNAIESTTVWSGSRLKVNIKNMTSYEILVSRERVSDFRAWLES